MLTVSQAKGLEFDSVLIADPAQILGESPRGLSDLYVAMTRATQRLGVRPSRARPRGAAPAGAPAMTAPVPGGPGPPNRSRDPQPRGAAAAGAAHVLGRGADPPGQPPGGRPGRRLPDRAAGRPGLPAAAPRPGRGHARRRSGPSRASPAGAVLAEFAAHVAPYPFGNGHPGFAAWVNSPPHPLGVLAEALAAAMDPSVAGGNHAAVHLEHQVIRWFAGLLGWPAGYSGQLVSGGSAATLTALAVARHRAAARAGARRPPATGWPAWRAAWCSTRAPRATAASPRRPRCSASARPAIRVVPSDPDHRMRPDELERPGAGRPGRREARGRGGGHRRAPRTPARSTRSARSPRCAPGTACGCTWTARTGRRRSCCWTATQAARERPGPGGQPRGGRAQMAVRPGGRRAGAAPGRRGGPGHVQPGARPTCGPTGTRTGRAARSGSPSTGSSRPARSGR